MDILKVIFEKQHELNKRILKERHKMDYDELCDHDKNNSDLEKKRMEWLLHYNRAQIHESIELEDSVPWKWWKDASPIDWQNIGIELIDEKPRIGAGGKRIAFLHPKSTHGVLIELSESAEE